MTTEARGRIPTTEAFGARLALIRWQNGWNQKEAGIACGFPQASWREWELSGRVPRNLIEVADKIARRTGIDAYWILTGRYPTGGPNGGEGLPRLDSNQQPLGYRGSRGVLPLSRLILTSAA